MVKIHKVIFNIVSKRKLYAYLFLLSLLIVNIGSVYSEGTKNIMPNGTYIGRLNFEPSFTNFAMYGCLTTERLNIHIANVGEKIYYGFGKVFDANQIQMYDLVYRIKDPNGNIVVNQTSVPSSGTGYISSYTKAYSGPDVVNSSGYPPLSYTATTTGDYYIEFYYNYNNTIGDRRELQYFDITVADSSSSGITVINGRVWSQEWQFTVTASPQPNPYDNPFYGKMYIYSDDSIVTSVDFNGLKPYVFAMSANSTGTANTGNIIQDRKSKAGRQTYPQYKIFLNDPDSIVYPSGLLGGFTAPLSFAGCPGSHCINVSTSKAGAIQLLIDLNGVPGYQIGTADLLIVQNVNAGVTCIPWNGVDGLGNPVAAGTVIKFKTTFVGGLTHLPIYDAEHNPNGYIINLVRPSNSSTTFSLYWDDSNFPNYINPPSTGCSNPNGCHVFTNMFGDQRTINTWWYASSNVEDSIMIPYYRIAIDSVATQNASCPNIADGNAIVYASGGNNPYTYSINGTNFQTTNTFSNLLVGNYTVTIVDSNSCLITDTFSILSSPNLLATTTTTNDTCNGSIGSISVNVYSGSNPYSYQWNTTPQVNVSTVNNLGAGIYTVTVTDSYNCLFVFTDTIMNVPSSIVLNPTVLHDTCGNNMGVISLNPTNGISPLTYTWNTSPPQNTSSISNLGAGNYSVSVVENNNCVTIQSFNILDMPAPIANFSLPDKACVGDSVTLIYIGNQTPPDNYTWSFGSALNLLGANLGPYSLSYSTPGKYFIQLDVSKSGCPSNTYLDSINLYEVVAQIDSLHNVDCFGGNNGYLSLDVNGGVLPYVFQWLPGGLSGIQQNSLTQGQYVINILDSIGCKAVVNANISEPAKLNIQFSITDASCDYTCDGKINGQVSGGITPYQYIWNPALFGNSPNANQVCPGNYSLKVIDKNNCSDSATAQVSYSTQILADFDYYFSTDYLSSYVGDFTFTGFGAQNYLWDFGDTYTSILENPIHQFADDNTYRVELIVNSGSPYFCTDTAVKMVKVLPPFNIFIPTAFSPNGDGRNDYLEIIASRVKEYHIDIYNRWGQVVFHGNSISEMWDGRYKNQVAPEDVYTYRIDVVSDSDDEYLKIGTITLIR
jgi:gliding motility-associated-like protein